MTLELFQSLIIALAVGAASGGIGAFVLLKRMALVGDALSHVALPGIALALAYRVDPFWGVIASLLAAAFFVFWLETKTAIPSEAAVGLLFTASLAIGVLTIPDHEILESLFGEFPLLPAYLLGVVAIGALVVLLITFFLAKRFTFRVISSELAAVNGIGPVYNLFFLLLFAVIVALGIKLMGTLLMGALTIIPASIAKNVTKSIKSYVVFSAFLGAAISLVGVALAHFLNVLPGPAIILLGAFLFAGSLFFSDYKGRFKKK